MMTVSPALSENLSDVPMARRPSRRFRARWLAVLAAAGCSFCTFRLGPLLGDQGRSGGFDGADWVSALEAVTAVGTVVALVATVGCNARDSASGPRFQLRIDPTTIGQIDEPIS